MMSLKTIYKKLISLPIWLILTLSFFCAAALITVFMKAWEETPVAYAVYVLSAYTLTLVCIRLVKILPTHYRKTKQRIYDHPLGGRYMTDTVFKVRASLYVSLAINLLYSVFKLTAGIIYSSFWWGAVAVYYMVLSLLRFLLLRYMRSGTGERTLLGEYRRYRLCALLMLILNLTLSGIVFLVVQQNMGYSYPGVLIFAVAAYTFYSVTISIVDLIRYRKHESPIVSAARAIRFASALVSLLSLETAMLAEFGGDETFRRTMTSATGAGVCITVLAMSVFMIIHANLEIKKHTKELNTNG